LKTLVCQLATAHVLMRAVFMTETADLSICRENFARWPWRFGGFWEWGYSGCKQSTSKCLSTSLPQPKRRHVWCYKEDERKVKSQASNLGLLAGV